MTTKYKILIFIILINLICLIGLVAIIYIYAKFPDNTNILEIIILYYWLAFAWYQLYQTKEINKQEMEWKKMDTTFNYYDSFKNEISKMRRQLIDKWLTKEAILENDEETKKLLSDAEVKRLLKDFLWTQENAAVWVNIGLFSLDIIKKRGWANVIADYIKYEFYILGVRERNQERWEIIKYEEYMIFIKNLCKKYKEEGIATENMIKLYERMSAPWYFWKKN